MRKRSEQQSDVLCNLSGNQVGSADIIAYEGNERILLIDCDIGSVDNSMFPLRSLNQFFEIRG